MCHNNALQLGRGAETDWWATCSLQDRYSNPWDEIFLHSNELSRVKHAGWIYLTQLIREVNDVSVQPVPPKYEPLREDIVKKYLIVIAVDYMNASDVHDFGELIDWRGLFEGRLLD